jgi:hypothetical protein
MSNPKKHKKSQSSEGGITVLDAPPEPSPGLSPIEKAASAAIVELATSAPAAAIWQRAKRVTGLWSKGEDRNSWVAIAGVGWKKLSDASDSANLALTILAAQALQTGRNIDYREESDGMIHEIYAW